MKVQFENHTIGEIRDHEGIETEYVNLFYQIGSKTNMFVTPDNKLDVELTIKNLERIGAININLYF